MKLSINWLKDYVSVGVSTEKLVHKLTMAGLEVERMTAVGKDTVLEIEVTPNRPDCLCLLGLAREVGAILNKPTKNILTEGRAFPKTKCPIVIEDKEGCPRYVGTVIEGVQVKAAEAKMAERITSVGLRSINNIVDITNFCLLEIGQPLHAFDYDKLVGGKIIVRRAKKGEKIITIDDVERELDPSILIIADSKRPVAIAGVMGGKETEVTEETRNILLESAYFDPLLIRRTSRKLGLMSDSSYRFERGVDFEQVNRGADRALTFILKQAGGAVTQRADVTVSRKKQKQPVIKVFIEDINRFLGIKTTAQACKDILKNLDFEIQSATLKQIVVRPPSFRQDVKQTVDVIEELARIMGYDQMPSEDPVIKVSQVSEKEEVSFRKNIQKELISLGFDEVLTYTLISRDELKRTNCDVDHVLKIRNPLSQDQEIMRPGLLPSFLSVVRSNLNRQQKNIRIFETGKMYTSSGERECLGVMLAACSQSDWRKDKEQPEDIYDLKGVVEQMISRLNRSFDPLSFGDCSESCLEKGQRAGLFLGATSIGMLGKVSDDVLDQWSIKDSNIYFVQMDMEKMMSFPRQKKTFESIPEYPAISRDISMAVDQNIKFDRIKDIIVQQGADILQSLTLVEEYLGEKIPEGQRGIVVSLNFLSKERTLTDDDVNAVHLKTCEALQKDLKATIR